jgi:hypothetical protein
MTPGGYLTITEVLSIIRGRIDDDDMLMQRTPKPDKTAVACESLAAAILGGNVDVYTVRGGSVTQISDLSTASIHPEKTRELMEGWEGWLASGRVSNAGKYNGCVLYLRPYDLKSWLGPEPEQVSTKTGAPGRPSVMPLVMEEFSRRFVNGETESTRKAEAKTLAAWFKEPSRYFPARRQTILNNLPVSFQPRGNGPPKQ